MVMRIIGLGLLLIVGVPLVLAFAPLILLGLGVWFLATRVWPGGVGASLPAALRTVRAKWPGVDWRTLVHDRRPGVARTSGAAHRRREHSVLTLAGIVLFFTLVGVLARQAPLVLVPALVAGAVLGLRAITRRPIRPAPVVPASTRPAPPLDAMSDAELRERVVTLLHESRFHGIQRVGQPGRTGIDLLARDANGHLFLVEFQQDASGNRAGSADVQRLIESVRAERAAGGIFVTTASFTRAAVNLAQYSRVPILLYDGQALDRLPARAAWASSAA